MQIRVNIKNLDTVLRSFGNTQERIMQAQREGLKMVALRLRDKATELSKGGHPNHPNVKSGRLSNSFRYKLQNEGAATVAYVGSEVKYAINVEFGHMSRSWGSEKWHWVPPYPFFRPAIVSVFDSGEAERIFEKVFKSVLK